MALNGFYRIARNTMAMWFSKTDSPAAGDVELEFWKHVASRQHHVCVHSGSIDTGPAGYGFPTAKNSSTSRHPWNLKMLTNNPGSILRFLGPIMGQLNILLYLEIRLLHNKRPLIYQANKIKALPLPPKTAVSKMSISEKKILFNVITVFNIQ